MNITITDEELAKAKADMIEFDKQKTYNKFKCSHNYIGLVGEIAFDKYLKSIGITYDWVDFIKKGWSQPDFIINGKTIDIKTTYKDSLWFPKPRFDVYILCKVASDDKTVTIEGMMTKEEMIDAMDSGVAKRIERFGRHDYCIHKDDLNSFDVKHLG